MDLFKLCAYLDHYTHHSNTLYFWKCNINFRSRESECWNNYGKETKTCFHKTYKRTFAQIRHSTHTHHWPSQRNTLSIGFHLLSWKPKLFNKSLKPLVVDIPITRHIWIRVFIKTLAVFCFIPHFPFRFKKWGWTFTEKCYFCHQHEDEQKMRKSRLPSFHNCR